MNSKIKLGLILGCVLLSSLVCSTLVPEAETDTPEPVETTEVVPTPVEPLIPTFTQTSSPSPTYTITPTQTVTSTSQPTSTTTSTPTPTPFVYIVKAGDTCATIAIQYGITMQSIILTNNLSVECILFEGQELQIQPQNPAVIPTESFFIYTVQEGDSMFVIAQVFGVTIQEIIIVNNLSEDDTLIPGQELLIPYQGSTPEG